MVTAIFIIHLTVTRFLIDDKSSCNILYKKALESLGLHQTDLSPLEGEDLLAFNDSVTHTCRAMDLTLSVREGMRKRTITLTFLVIHYKSAFKGILGRSFLDKLDMVVSMVHLKIAYHEEKGVLSTITTDLQEVERILILGDILTSVTKNCDMLDLDV